jgi:hypothetical protein
MSWMEMQTPAIFTSYSKSFRNSSLAMSAIISSNNCVFFPIVAWYIIATVNPTDNTKPSAWMIQLEAKAILVSGLIAGVVVLVLSMVISTVMQAMFDYDVMALAGMRSVNDPVSILFFLFPFVVGMAMAILYDFTKKSFTGTTTRRGILLGVLGWIVFGVPSAFIVFSSMDYPIGFTVNSVVGSLVYMLGAGIAITRLSK